MKRLLPVILLLTLCGCGDWLEPPEMQKPIGAQTAIPPQDTPELEARAVKEREDAPVVPAPADPETYSNLGTVPPRPKMPTPTEIAGQVRELAQEQSLGNAIILQQQDAAEPETLPKTAEKSAKGAPPPEPPSASDSQVSFGNPNAFLPQSQLQQTDRLPADAP